jgi:hypothetical protein
VGNLTTGTTGWHGGCTVLTVKSVNWWWVELDAAAIGARKWQTGGSSPRGEDVRKLSSPFNWLGKQGERSVRESGHWSVMKTWCAGYGNEAGRGFDETVMVRWGRENGADYSASQRRKDVGRQWRMAALGWEIDGGATMFGGRG